MFQRVILFGLLFMPVVVLGQWDVSVFGGAGLGRLPTDLMPVTSRGEFQEVHSGPSWSAGLAVRHVISAPLHFATGIHWTSMSGRDEYWLRGFMVSSAERRLSYVSLPMLLELDLWRLRMGGGFQVGYLVAQQGWFIQDLTFLSGPYTETSTQELGLRDFDIGLVGRISFMLTPRWEAGIRFYRGMTDIKDHTDGYLSPLWTQQLIGTVAYRLWPKCGKAEQPATPVPEPLQED